MAHFFASIHKHDNGILLIYKGYTFVFSTDNKLITAYKNEKIPL